MGFVIPSNSDDLKWVSEQNSKNHVNLLWVSREFHFPKNLS